MEEKELFPGMMSTMLASTRFDLLVNENDFTIIMKFDKTKMTDIGNIIKGLTDTDKKKNVIEVVRIDFSLYDHTQNNERRRYDLLVYALASFIFQEKLGVWKGITLPHTIDYSLTYTWYVFASALKKIENYVDVLKNLYELNDLTTETKEKQDPTHFCSWEPVMYGRDLAKSFIAEISKSKFKWKISRDEKKKYSWD